MDRRYRYELQMVKVPVIWKAKIPEKKIKAKRRIPKYRRIIIDTRRKVENMFERLFGSADPDKLFEDWELTKKNYEGKYVAFKRFETLPPIARIKMRIEEDEDNGH